MSASLNVEGHYVQFVKQWVKFSFHYLKGNQAIECVIGKSLFAKNKRNSFSCISSFKTLHMRLCGYTDGKLFLLKNYNYLPNTKHSQSIPNECRRHNSIFLGCWFPFNSFSNERVMCYRVKYKERQKGHRCACPVWLAMPSMHAEEDRQDPSGSVKKHTSHAGHTANTFHQHVRRQ